MLAEIANGNVGWAEGFYLVAVILAALAAVLVLVGNRPRRVNGTTAPVVREYVYAPVLGWLAVAFLALGFVML